VVFGLLELLGISYRPALADLPDQKGWRIKADAGYGPLGTFARGKIDLAKIRRNWEDILRVVASALEEQRNGEWRYLEFLQVTSLITAGIFMREIPGGTRARHGSRPVDLPEHRY
jgi:Tn3 transposase DDE domain